MNCHVWLILSIRFVVTWSIMTREIIEYVLLVHSNIHTIVLVHQHDNLQYYCCCCPFTWSITIGSGKYIHCPFTWSIMIGSGKYTRLDQPGQYHITIDIHKTIYPFLCDIRKNRACSIFFLVRPYRDNLHWHHCAFSYAISERRELALSSSLFALLETVCLVVCSRCLFSDRVAGRRCLLSIRVWHTSLSIHHSLTGISWVLARERRFKTCCKLLDITSVRKCSHRVTLS